MMTGVFTGVYSLLLIMTGASALIETDASFAKYVFDVKLPELLDKVIPGATGRT